MKAQPASASTVLKAQAERRRSPRIRWRIPLIATWTPGRSLILREQGETEIVNAHGALIKLSTHVRPGFQIKLMRPGTELCRTARVVSSPGLSEDGRVRLAISLDSPGEDFWVQMAR